MALDTRDCQLLLCHQLTICFGHQSISLEKKKTTNKTSDLEYVSPSNNFLFLQFLTN